MLDDKKKTYRNIMKSTAVFGGVQVFSILINLIKGKLIASLLGPYGMGISALFTSTISTINQFAGLGINISAMRELSVSHNEKDIVGLSEKIKIYKRLILFAAISGGLVTLILSPILSQLVFHNYKYTIPFALLSLFVVFTVLSTAEITLLQSTGQLKSLAKSTLIGPVVGLMISVPLYYIYGNAAIAPAMVILAAITYGVNYYFTKKIERSPTLFSLQKFKQMSKIWISLGLILMLANLLGTLELFLVNTYIGRFGNIKDVGLFQSALSVSDQYVGIIFVAMAVDYYPKLSAISHDKSKLSELVNKQSEIILLLIAPIIMILVLTAPIIIRILLTSEFLVISPVVKWMGIGLFFKAASYPLGYIALAKGDNKVFFWVEAVLGNIIIFTFNVVFYHYWGLVGLGISFLVSFTVYYLLIITITTKLYSFSYYKHFFKLFATLLIAIVTIFVLSFQNGLIYVLAELAIFIFGAYYCYVELNKRLDIKKLISEKLNRRK